MKRHPHETAERFALRRLVASCVSATADRLRTEDAMVLHEAQALLDATRLDALGYHVTKIEYGEARPYTATRRDPGDPNRPGWSPAWYAVGTRYGSAEAAARACEHDAQARGRAALEPASRRPIARHHRQGEA